MSIRVVCAHPPVRAFVPLRNRRALPGDPSAWQVLALTIDCWDSLTGDHSQRVAHYAGLIADEMMLDRRERKLLEIGARLHDIGKMAIPTAVLDKPGPLTPAEVELMRAHPLHGFKLLQSIPTLAPILPIVRSHHERWDGAGYPDRLAGEDIPFLARVIAIADAFDAMTSDRAYRPALRTETAIALIADAAGSQFDAELARAFVRMRPSVVPA